MTGQIEISFEPVLTGQCKRVYDYMKRNGSINPDEARDDIAVARLASRIHDLKDVGINIADEWVHGTNRYGEPFKFKRYWLV